MKKSLSVLLAVIMLFSSFSAVQVSAEDSGIADMLYSAESIAASEAALENFKVDNLPAQFDNFDTFRKSAAWKDVNLMGMGLDFLYSADRALYWAELDIWAEDENGNPVYDVDGSRMMKITRDDVSLAFLNIGLYLQRIFYNRYGGLNLYTIENAISLANIIGNIFYPDFENLDVNNFRNYFTNEVPSANEFFRAVTKLSKLDVVINGNWLIKGKSFYQPVIDLLGGTYISLFDEHYEDGLILGSKILEGAMKKLIAVGPVDYAYDLINILSSSSYNFVYREPVLALFSHKLPVMGSSMSLTELNSFDGLLKLIFCKPSCNSSSSGTGFCPVDFPVERFSFTTDKDEKLIYLYYYFNLCGRYKDNRSFFENMKTSVAIDPSLSAEDKVRLEGLIDGFFLGEFENTVKNSIIPLYKDNISTAKTTLSERIKNAFMTLLKKIADYFDYLRKIFSGELDYGQGNSPFN